MSDKKKKKPKVLTGSCSTLHSTGHWYQRRDIKPDRASLLEKVDEKEEKGNKTKCGTDKQLRLAIWK